MGTVFTIDIRDPGDWAAAIADVVALAAPCRRGVQHLPAGQRHQPHPARRAAGCRRRSRRRAGARPVRAGSGRDRPALHRHAVRRLDPTGLVKGWAIERASRLLREHGSPTTASTAAVTCSWPARRRPVGPGRSASATRRTAPGSSAPCPAATSRSPRPELPSGDSTFSTRSPAVRRLAGQRIGRRPVAHLRRRLRHRGLRAGPAGLPVDLRTRRLRPAARRHRRLGQPGLARRALSFTRLLGGFCCGRHEMPSPVAGSLGCRVKGTVSTVSQSAIGSESRMSLIARLPSACQWPRLRPWPGNLHQPDQPALVCQFVGPPSLPLGDRVQLRRIGSRGDGEDEHRPQLGAGRVDGGSSTSGVVGMRPSGITSSVRHIRSGIEVRVLFQLCWVVGGEQADRAPFTGLQRRFATAEAGVLSRASLSAHGPLHAPACRRLPSSEIPSGTCVVIVTR